MKDILLQNFGIDAIDIKKLAGYENINYRVATTNGIYVFKTYKYDEHLFNLLVAESKVLDYLSAKNDTQFPHPLKTIDNLFVKKIKVVDEYLIIRLLTFLEGTFLAESKHTPELFQSFGVFLAKMDSELLQIHNYTIEARKYEWDVQHVLLNTPFIQKIQAPEKRKVVAYFLQQFREIVAPELSNLRLSILHNDANDWNVLVKEGKISGIIDFGDIVYSPLINELAVAICYAIMGKDDPISWACQIISGYHSILPLEEKELDLLYYLVAAQLCISVCNSANNKLLDPDNTYISISEKPAWELLFHWLKINPLFAKNEFRKAANFQEIQSEPIVKKVAKRHQYISPIVSLSYGNPIYMERAAFQYMYDGYGNTFLDAYNNIPHVGHSHPKVVEAGQRQMAKLNTNTRYVYDLLNEYSEKLLAKFPSTLNKVYFVNSGSAASDLAIRLARHHTKSENIMVMEHGYHGHTNIGIDISDYKFNNKKGPGQKSYILKTPMPDTYWGQHKEADAGQKYALEAMELVKLVNWISITTPM